ncbi:MAG: DNA polymerase III subunit gamma/tau [Chlorobi bacterium]|nr:DNA polymerase III subunit gamma/tau [Chlorobiota bacterium]
MENFIVSARKYRPATFKQVVGQDSITSTLQNAIRNNQVAQAFLFTGPRGVGKTTCARILAKTINCENLTDTLEPCNRCESCIAFNNNASFNIHELDAASNNSVEDIRTLVDQVRIPPQVGKYKVYIIDEVHMLSQAAFNAFLKTLEEPPAYAKFILATTEKHKILPTILSRCQIFDFKRISVEDIAGHLAYVAKNEGVDAEVEALHIIAQKADGALRDALSTFDQIVSYSGKELTYKQVIENLNILDYEYYFRVTDAMLAGDISQLLLVFNQIIENGFDGQDFITGLNEHFRNLLVIKDPATLELLLASPSLKERYNKQAASCPAELLMEAMKICNKYDLDYKTSNNKRLHIEIALMQLSRLVFAPQERQMPKTAAPSPPSVVKEKPVQYSEKKTEPQPQQASLKQPVTKTETKPLQTPEQKPVTGTGTSGKSKIKHISIKDSLEALKRKDDNKETKEEEVIATEFDQQKLLDTWHSFVESYKSKSPSFAAAIGKYDPVLKENFTIEYKVDNIIIAQDVLNVTALLEFLKKELKNNQISLKHVLPKKTDKKVAYTDRERFEEMAKKYPGIIKLKDQLNLELEF